ncbi:uncharacterized protein ACIBXB_008796 [Morphnus guianensis]
MTQRHPHPPTKSTELPREEAHRSGLRWDRRSIPPRGSSGARNDETRVIPPHPPKSQSQKETGLTLTRGRFFLTCDSRRAVSPPAPALRPPRHVSPRDFREAAENLTPSGRH